MRHLTRFSVVCLTAVMVVLIVTQIVNVSTTLAATIDKINVTCQFVKLGGKTEVNAPYVRVQVALASDLTKVIAQQVVSTRPYAGTVYHASLDIRKSHLAEGTLLIISAGEWDGTHYLRPATLISQQCSHSGVPTPTPRVPASPTPPRATATIPVTYVASPTSLTPSPTFLPTSTFDITATASPTSLTPSPTFLPTSTLGITATRTPTPIPTPACPSPDC
jgi:hypothetical protein